MRIERRVFWAHKIKKMFSNILSPWILKRLFQTKINFTRQGDIPCIAGSIIHKHAQIYVYIHIYTVFRCCGALNGFKVNPPLHFFPYKANVMQVSPHSYHYKRVGWCVLGFPCLPEPMKYKIPQWIKSRGWTDIFWSINKNGTGIARHIIVDAMDEGRSPDPGCCVGPIYLYLLYLTTFSVISRLCYVGKFHY